MLSRLHSRNHDNLEIGLVGIAPERLAAVRRSSLLNAVFHDSRDKDKGQKGIEKSVGNTGKPTVKGYMDGNGV